MELRVATDDVEASLGNIHILCQSSHVDQGRTSNVTDILSSYFKLKKFSFERKPNVKHCLRNNEFFAEE